MRSLNKVMLIGNVGKDPETNFTPQGARVAQFRVATTERWTDKDGTSQEHTDWHTVVAWRGLAEVVEKYVRRGTRLYIEGRLQSRSFEDRDGHKRYVTEIVAENLLLLDGRKPDGSSTGSEHDKTHTGDADGSDEIPF